MRAYENGHINEHEMNIVRESQLKITPRRSKEAIVQAQCQVDEEMKIFLESQSRLTEKGDRKSVV